MDFIHDNWQYIVGLGAVAAYLFEKAYSIWTEKKKKRQAYNRLFSAIIKLYYSYLKHKQMYSDRQILNMPKEIYAGLVKQINNFNKDLDEFKEEIFKESEIIPEITFDAYMLFNLIDSIRTIDKIDLSSALNIEPVSDKENFEMKVALFYAQEEVFEDFFAGIIKDVKKHTSVKKKFVKQLLDLKEPENQKKAEQKQMEILKRYFESLYKQGVFTEESYRDLIKALNLN